MICDKRKRVLYIVTEIEVLNQLLDASSVKRELFLIKDLRRTERTYKKAMAVDIETMVITNPNELWEKIRKLGPRNVKDIPMEVVDESGAV